MVILTLGCIVVALWFAEQLVVARDVQRGEELRKQAWGN